MNPLLVALLLQISPVPDAPAASPPPLAASTYAELYATTTVVTSTNVPTTRADGALFLAQLGRGRAGYSIRALVTGVPGKFSSSDLSTYQDAEVFAAVHVNLISQRAVTCGVNALVGYSMPLETQYGISPSLPRAMTAGFGLSCTSAGRTVWVDVGQCQALSGVCGMSTWIWPVVSNSSGSLQLVTIGDMMVGARQRRVTRISAAVRVKLWK